MIRGWSIFDTYEARVRAEPGHGERNGRGETPEEWLQIKANVVQAKRCKKYFFGDYYPLANQKRNPVAWRAYHLYLPAEQEGMILALRLAKSDVSSMTFDLLTIDPAKRWKFEDYDSGDTWAVSGKEIREHGFEVAIPNPRDSRLIFYSIDRAETPEGQ